MTYPAIDRLPAIAHARRMAYRFTYRVSFSVEDDQYVGTCSAFPSLSHLDKDHDTALRGIRDLVIDTLADMRASREAVPKSPVAPS